MINLNNNKNELIKQYYYSKPAGTPGIGSGLCIHWTTLIKQQI